MHRIRARRLFIETQNYLTRRLADQTPIYTKEIQEVVFGAGYDPDSQYQKMIIRDNIVAGI